MAGRPDPKPAARIVDPACLRAFRMTHSACAACGVTDATVHHVIPKGEGGDDVEGNLVMLCGHGTARCHGAFHGNPYVVDGVRRDAAWVKTRAGRYIRLRRPDVVRYVLSKLGTEQGTDYLERVYPL